ncbi:hypothetical protein, partial [Turicibacter bilis]|uniref:hypothetical protein n=1 Tax=Turicibacter bilis TaxID=2735723 RepID=UPI001BB043E7
SLQGSMMVGEQGTANEVAERLDKPNQSLQGSMMVGEQGTANEVAERLDKPNQSLQGSMMVGEQGTANEIAERLDKPNQSLQGSMMVGEQGRDNEVAKRLDKSNQTLQSHIQDGASNLQNQKVKQMDSSEQPQTGHLGYKPSIREMAQQSHIGRQIAKTNSQAQQWIGDKKQVVINKGLDTVKSGINYADQIAMPLINKMSPILPPPVPKNGEIQPMPSSVLMKDRTPTTHPYSQPLGQQNLSSPKVVVPPPKMKIGNTVERPIQSQLNIRGFDRNSNVNRESQTLVSNRGSLNKPPQK